MIAGLATRRHPPSWIHSFPSDRHPKVRLVETIALKQMQPIFRKRRIGQQDPAMGKTDIHQFSREIIANAWLGGVN